MKRYDTDSPTQVSTEHRERRDMAVTIVSTTDGLGNGRADVDNTKLGAPLHLVAEWHSVGDHQGGEDASVQGLNGIARQNTVGNKGQHRLGAVLLEHRGSLDQSAAGISHVVNENGNLVLNVADKDHATDNVWPGALLVDESESGVEVIGNRGSALGTAGIG